MRENNFRAFPRKEIFLQRRKANCGRFGCHQVSLKERTVIGKYLLLKYFLQLCKNTNNQ